MQVAVQPDCQTLIQKATHTSATGGKDRSPGRRERRILAEYLVAEAGGKVLGIVCGNHFSEDYCTDQADLSDALTVVGVDDPRGAEQVLPKSLRTPYAAGTFRAVVCFRLGRYLSAEDLEDLLWEACRICAPGGRLIIDVPAAECRGIFRRRSAARRVGHAHTHAAVEDYRGTRWREVATIGSNLLPLDLFPAWLRGSAARLNDRLCRTPLRKYAHERTYVFEKC